MMKAFALAGLLLAAAHYACAQIRLPFRCNGCERDEHGKIKRSRKAVNDFRKANPAPVACKSQRCVVDHIIPLACAANAEDQKKLDDPRNMQWQTAESGKAKDQWELQLCGVTINQRRSIAGQYGQSLPPSLVGVGAKSPIATPQPLPVWEFHQDGTIKRLGQPFEALSHIGGGKLKRCDLSKVLTSNPPKTACSIGTYNTKGEWIHERTVYE